MKDSESNPPPPALARALLAWRLHARRTEVLDDMNLLFQANTETYGVRKARWLYARDALNIAVLGIGDTKRELTLSFDSMMLQNYLKIARRNFQKHKAFAGINAAGLAIGMAACLLILQYVTHELSYDRVPDADRIYRVENNYIRGGQLIYESAATFPGVAPAMRKHFPAVEAAARFYHSGLEEHVILTYEAAENPVTFAERNLLFADPSFLTLFDVNVLRGNPATALQEAGAVLLSTAAARRYFGDTDPLGNVLRFNDNALNEHLLTVTGIFEDDGRNRHVRYDILASYKTLYTRRPEGETHYEGRWWDYQYYTYVRLRPGVDPATIEAGMPTLLDTYRPDYTEVDQDGNQVRKNEFSLVPLRDIHLYSRRQNEVGVNGNGTLVYFLLIVAIFILLIAWINYINLATARAVDRAKEVGVRKVIGSSRGQITRQFLFESLMLNLGAVGLALVLVQAAQPYFNALTGQSLSLWQWTDPLWWLGMLGVFWVGALLAGLYPAFVLSAFQPVTVLKGSFRHASQGAALRKGLVVFQFTASIALIAGTFTVYRQLDFMTAQDLGFDMERMMIIEQPGRLENEQSVRMQRVETFKQLATAVPGVRAVAASTIIPGRGIHRGIILSRTYHGEIEDVRSIEPVTIDYDFLEAYDFTITVGRNFSRDFASDSIAIILNASAVRALGFATAEAALGETIYEFGAERREIIGVLADYHHETLRRSYDPMYFLLRPQVNTYYSIKLEPGHPAERIAGVKAAYEAAFPGNPFGYYFLDALFDQQYRADRQFGGMFRFFAGLAILVACLGLYGLAAFTTVQRSKEIGIRKVLGATLTDILRLVSTDFVRLVLWAAVVAVPLAYVGLDAWLAGYAFRIGLHWWLFGLPVLLVAALALLTVGSQALKAAVINPVECLRAE